MAMEASTSSSCDGRSRRGYGVILNFSGRSRRGYGVILNFRGSNIILTITNCLYNGMIHAGIHAFKDNEELRFGEEIGGGISQVINESRIYIPIISNDYASSRWCLRELAQMVEYKRRSTDDDQKAILPIFFYVDANDVRLMTDLNRQALQNHRSNSSGDLVKLWEKALKEVGRIGGKNQKDYSLVQLTRLMVKEVSNLYRQALQNHRSDSREDPVKQSEEASKEVGRIMGKNPKDYGPASCCFAPETKLRIYEWVSDMIQSKDPAPSIVDLRKELESKDTRVFKGEWIDRLDALFKEDIEKRKKKKKKNRPVNDNYDYRSVIDLVRFIRNKSSHPGQLKPIEGITAWDDERICSYFDDKFPDLWVKLYTAARRFCGEEAWFKFYRNSR